MVAGTDDHELWVSFNEEQNGEVISSMPCMPYRQILGRIGVLGFQHHKYLSHIFVNFEVQSYNQTTRWIVEAH